MKVRMENAVVLLVLICERCFWFIILLNDKLYRQEGYKCRLQSKWDQANL